MLPFTVPFEEGVVDDVRARLARTRYSDPTPGREGAGPLGIDGGVLRDLIEYWASDFDWAAECTRLNGYPQIMTTIDGSAMHAVHRRAADASAPAILLLHGWPYSFAEMLPLADRLSDFHVVAPSLPGFAFSEPLDELFTESAVAERLHALMAACGYERYFTYGEDVGAGISDRIAAQHPESVSGVFATHASFGARERGELDADGERFSEWMAAKWARASGYASIQGTRPDTLAVALNDSPAGLAAWIIEKLLEWCDGDALEVIGRDAMLTTVMLYWTTGSIASSFRPYVDGSIANEEPIVPFSTPAAVLVHRGEHEYPRSMAEATYLDLRSFEKLERGGHFTALEAPDEVATGIRSFARSLAM